MSMSEQGDDRRRASTDLTCDLAVTAGAGAGKTTVLVDRFVAIARDAEIGPERILAITFTRKAAAEMKDRIIQILEACHETALRRATEAAYISTIHGFAERVLREHPFDARVDPSFSVITDAEQKLWLQEATQGMYAREDLRAFAPRLKKSFDGGWQIFSLVSDVARLIREGPECARREADLIEDEERCVELALDRARAKVREAGREMLEYLRELYPILDGATFKSAGVRREQWRAYVDAVRRCLRTNSVGAESDIWNATAFTGQIPEQERGPIRVLLDNIKRVSPHATFSDWQAQEAHERELIPLKRAIYSAADAIDRSYADRKRVLGALDFNDLQLRAAELLERNSSVRAEYADRFRHILLDESQDTDELQYRIIQALRTSTNTLFMVGDPKQAIYEFRGANPDLFQSAIERLPEAARLQLAENFRSRSEVISFINRLGMPLLPDQFVPIHAHADYEAKSLAGPAVSLVYAEQRALDEYGKKFEGVSDARPREAAAVAEEIVRLLRAGTQVRDPDAREVKWVRLSPRHIGILFRTRIAIPYFERALADRGIPYVTASGQGFYDRAEVLDCLMLLRAVAQPLDDLAMAAVLRSPFVGASDADLWRLREPMSDHVPQVWIALQQYAPLAEFRATFSDLRTRTRGLSAAEVLDDAIRTFGYQASLAAHRDGPAMLGNVAKIRRQLRTMADMSPLEAYYQLESSRELLPTEPTAPLVGSADDVVVLTTIHQAKGLEWPIVCLPNLQSPPMKHASLFSARHGALLCKPLEIEGTSPSLLSLEVINAEIKARAEAEERRLLYVALTRARERLILSACVKEKVGEEKERTWPPKAFNALTFLAGSSDGALTNEGEHDVGSYRTHVIYVRDNLGERTMYNGDQPLAETWEPEAGGLPEPAPAIITASPLSLKVTELLEYRRCPQVYRFSQVLEVKEHIARRATIRAGGSAANDDVTPVELGTIVHALLERIRFDAADPEAEIARVVAEEAERRRPALTKMLKGVVQGEIGAAIRNAKRVEREWPFATRIGGVMVEGVIDLAIQAQDGRWAIVDYKSNDISPVGRYEHLTEYYAPQLELYAMALAGAGGASVSDCVLVFLSGPRIHRWSFDSCDRTLRAWSEQTVTQIANRDFTTEAGPKCGPCGYRKQKICDVGALWSRNGIGSGNRRIFPWPQLKV